MWVQLDLEEEVGSMLVCGFRGGGGVYVSVDLEEEVGSMLVCGFRGGGGVYVRVGSATGPQ